MHLIQQLEGASENEKELPAFLYTQNLQISTRLPLCREKCEMREK